MKDLNSLENLMGSWKPRGPSARLERRLWGSREQSNPDAEQASADSLWAGWVPHLRQALPAGGGLLLLVCLTVIGGGWSQGSSPAPRVPILAALSNQSWVVDASLVDIRRNVPSAILGWTNREGFPSTSPSLDQLNTNHLWPRL